jgi:hypothetical protein
MIFFDRNALFRANGRQSLIDQSIRHAAIVGQAAREPAVTPVQCPSDAAEEDPRGDS